MIARTFIFLISATLSLRAASLQELYAFPGGAVNPNSLTLASSGTFYGTTANGGAGTNGTVFRLTPNGQLTTIATFGSTNGQSPQAALTQGRDGAFYGTTYLGGALQDG